MRREPVVRIRQEQDGEDRYGNPTYGPVETQLPEALFAPGGTSEPVEVGRNPVVSSPSLYWPRAWPDVVSDDTLRVRGREYAVDGEPADWRGSSVGGLVVTLKAVEG